TFVLSKIIRRYMERRASIRTLLYIAGGTLDDWMRRQDYYERMAEMYETAGFTNIKTQDDGRRPGNDIHEMGGVRMGHDPKTSLLNKWNQLHLCKNVYVTDGACMTSTATQNPTLTYMALAARAVDHAVKESKTL